MNKKFIKTITGLMQALFVYICPVKVQAEVRQPIGPVDIQSITKYVEQKIY